MTMAIKRWKNKQSKISDLSLDSLLLFGIRASQSSGMLSQHGVLCHLVDVHRLHSSFTTTRNLKLSLGPSFQNPSEVLVFSGE